MARNYGGCDALWFAVENLAPVDCTRALIDAGIDIATKDLEGSGLLARAIIHNSLSWASALLENGADIEAADNDGDTALMESLFFHSDDCLKLLLDCGADHTKIDSYGDHFLHDVAIYGGLRTIEIVHTTVGLKDIDIYGTNRQGKTALEMARNRQDKPDGFKEAFESLLASIQVQGQHSKQAEFGDGNPLDQLPGVQGQESEDTWYDAPVTQMS